MNSESKAPQPLLTPLMRWFLLAMVLANVAGGMLPMLMPLYLEEMGASVGQIGMVFTITSIAVLALQIFGGWVSDSIGRLRAIAIGSIGGIIGYTALLLAPTWEWMILALAIHQLPYALVGPSFGAFIAENSTLSNRGKVYGLVDTIYQITGIVGPPLGGFLAGTYSFKLMLLVSGLLYALAAALRIWMATTMHTATVGSEKLSLRSLKTSMGTMVGLVAGGGVITWIFVTDGVRDVAFNLSGSLQPLYLEQIGGLTVQQIGLLGSIFSAAMMVTPILSGRISDRYGERVPITAGFLLMFVALVIFLNASGFWGFALTWVVFGLGVGLLSPAYQSLMSKVVPQNMLGVFTGLFRSSIGLLSLPAPYIGARLWEHYGPRVPFIITAIAAFVTVVPVWFKFKVPEQTRPPAACTEADPSP
ncbi:MAG: MFS transporter [Anaerolineae bacterium]|nr:MFS transporter [Anaerolineae bacterium]